MFVGNVGVDAFLLSHAFLLAHASFSTSTQPTIVRSVLRRLFRLWPLYALFLMVNAPMYAGAQTHSDWGLYLGLAQNLAWPHPGFVGEAWIVAAAAMLGVLVPLVSGLVRSCGFGFALAMICLLLLVGMGIRAHWVLTQDPSFDLGVRKILLARLDLPLYGVIGAWLWKHRRESIRKVRHWLALIGALLLLACLWVHLAVPLDASRGAKILLFTLDGIALLIVILAAATASASGAWRLSAASRAFAACAYSGLLSHISVLRLALLLGLPLACETIGQGLVTLLAMMAVMLGVAALVHYLLDRPLLALRERWLAATAREVQPVAER